MHSWTDQDANSRFSELLDACMTEGPQLVTSGGAEAAVLVPVDEWRRMQAAVRASLKSLLLDDSNRVDMLIPERRRARRRSVESPG